MRRLRRRCRRRLTGTVHLGFRTWERPLARRCAGAHLPAVPQHSGAVGRGGLRHPREQGPALARRRPDQPVVERRLPAIANLRAGGDRHRGEQFPVAGVRSDLRPGPDLLLWRPDLELRPVSRRPRQQPHRNHRRKTAAAVDESRGPGVRERTVFLQLRRLRGAAALRPPRPRSCVQPHARAALQRAPDRLRRHRPARRSQRFPLRRPPQSQCRPLLRRGHNADREPQPDPGRLPADRVVCPRSHPSQPVARPSSRRRPALAPRWRKPHAGQLHRTQPHAAPPEQSGDLSRRSHLGQQRHHPPHLPRLRQRQTRGPRPARRAPPSAHRAERRHGRLRPHRRQCPQRTHPGRLADGGFPEFVLGGAALADRGRASGQAARVGLGRGDAGSGHARLEPAAAQRHLHLQRGQHAHLWRRVSRDPVAFVLLQQLKQLHPEQPAERSRRRRPARQPLGRRPGRRGQAAALQPPAQRESRPVRDQRHQPAGGHRQLLDQSHQRHLAYPGPAGAADQRVCRQPGSLRQRLRVRGHGQPHAAVAHDDELEHHRADHRQPAPAHARLHRAAARDLGGPGKRGTGSHRHDPHCADRGRGAAECAVHPRCDPGRQRQRPPRPGGSVGPRPLAR